MRKLLTVLLLLSSVCFAKSISTAGTGGGAFSSAGTWAGGLTFANGDTVTIVGSDTLTLQYGASATILSVTCSTPGSGTLQIYGAFTMNGDVTGCNIVADGAAITGNSHSLLVPTTSGATYSIHNSKVDHLAGFDTSNAATNSIISLVNNQFTNAGDYSGRGFIFGFLLAPRTGSGKFELINNYFDNGLQLIPSTAFGDFGLVLKGNTWWMAGNAGTVHGVDLGGSNGMTCAVGNCDYNLIWARNTSPGATSGAPDWTYLPAGTIKHFAMLGSNATNDGGCAGTNHFNWLATNLNSTTDNVAFNIVDSYMEPDCGEATSNGIESNNNTHPTFVNISGMVNNTGKDNRPTYTIGINQTTGCSSHSCTTVTVKNSTLGAYTGVMYSENDGAFAGQYTATNNVLFNNSSAKCWAANQTIATGAFPAGTWTLNNNNPLNCNTALDSNGAITAGAVVITNPVTGDPTVNNLNFKFLTWCQTLDPAATTWPLCAAHFANGDAGYTPQAFFNAMRWAFTPTNSAFASNGTNGTYTGGANYQSTSMPHVMFTDLDSGPKTGGESNQGVYVCLYGNNFGASHTTQKIYVGGVEASNYKTWGSSGLPTATDKACFQMGATTPSGLQDITLVTSTGSSTLSNAFTVRSGNIYFLDPVSGLDTNPGTVTLPWGTYDHATESISAGDTVYVRASTTTTRSTHPGCGPCVRGVLVPYTAGTSGNPQAVVSYPGETVVIGQDTDAPACATANCSGFWAVGGYPNTASYWTVAGIEAHGTLGAFTIRSGLTNMRLVGNRATCPNQSNQEGCIELSDTDNNSVLYGNEVFNVGTGIAGGSIKYTHGLYLGTDDHDMDAGWNYVHTLHACRGIQIHSSPTTTGVNGKAIYNLNIHDNWVEDVGCNGIALGTTDPSLGYVNAYNNICKNVGTGNYDIGSSTSDYACVYLDEGNDWHVDDGGTSNGTCSTTPCTFTTNTAGLTVTGVNTLFTHLARGWALVSGGSGDNPAYAYYIDTCSDDTHCTLFSTTFSADSTGVPLRFRKSGRGNANVYNNTSYQPGICSGANHGTINECGGFSRPRSDSMTAPLLIMNLQNNATQQQGTHPYIVNYPTWSTYISGNNNLWYNGIGTVPTTSDQTGNPNFVSTSDFRPQSGSPLLANGSNTTSTVTTDFLGVLRNPASVSIGAYQNATGAGSSNGSIQTQNTIRTANTVIQ